LATGQNIADEARADLNDGDAGNFRWSDAEMLRFIVASARQIVMLVPEANVVEESMALAIGSRQSIPTGGVKFLGAYNITVDGADSIRGPAITVVEEDALSSSTPTWLTTLLSPSVDGTIQHIVHDPRDPKTFSVYPRRDNTAVSVFVKHSKIPTAMASLAATFPLGDEYINAAVEYVKYRMLNKDGRYGSEPAVRLELYNNFLRALGLKAQADARVDPAQHRPPEHAHG
jgi:hypothetical protein